MRRYLAALATLFACSAAVAAPAEITIAGDHVFPESITSSKDGTIYIGSAGQGMIYRVAPGTADATPFVPPGKDLMSVLGVLADDASGRLYACSNDWSAMGTQTLGTKGPSALKVFDLKSGALEGSFELPGATGLCNDIAVGKDGAAYVTDTLNPRILRLAPGASALEIWSDDPAFAKAAAKLDGIAFGPDGSLYVNDFGGGKLFRVAVGKDMTPGAVTELTPSQPLIRLDGMRPLAGAKGPVFLLIEGGHLDTISIVGDTAQVTVIGADVPAGTGVTQVGQTAWAVEGQLNYLFDPSLKGKTPAPFHAVAVALPAGK